MKRGRRKTNVAKGLRRQIIITVLLFVALGAEAFLLAWRSSHQLASSVSNVWQGILETRGQQISETIFKKNHYLEPDTLYLAKLEPAFYGDSALQQALVQSVREGRDPYYIAQAISNICINIKKGISYSSNLRSCYWMLEDANAPYVLVNGTQTLKTELFDNEWMDECYAIDGDVMVEWRTIPLSYLNTTRVLTVYRRVVSERFMAGQTITGYWVLNYDLSNVLNALAANMSSSERTYLYDLTRDEQISVGGLMFAPEDEAELLAAARAAAENESVIGAIRNEQGERFYYRVDRIGSRLASIVCLQNLQVSRALDSTITSVGMILLVSCIAVVAINIVSLIHYSKYNRGLRKMFEALNSHKEESNETDNPHESTGSEYLLQRILNNEVDIQELQGLVESKQELRAELDALFGHVQINSHFLLNTLDSIYWSSVSHTGAFSRESAMIEDLCQILKYALDSSDLYTGLQEELECADKYIRIQQLRKNISFNVEWDVPEELKNARVGKLILQPVIENCIQHGFQNRSGISDCIRISAEKTDDEMLHIYVEDNGHGISEKQIKQLNLELKKQRYLHSRHIGMANVNRRLQVQFGANSGVSLYAIPGGGLRVCLTMKYSIYSPDEPGMAAL